MSEQSGQRQTIIDAGTGFKGNFDSDCPIVVKGRIEGQMSAPSLTVDATGSVSGTVKVKELRSEGVIAGEYDADYVKLSGAVKDNTIIRAKTLEVNLSPPGGRMQVTFGTCELAVGDTPDKAAAVAAAETGGTPDNGTSVAGGDDPFAAGGGTEPPPPMEEPRAVESFGDAAMSETGEGKRKDKRRNTTPPEAR